MADPKCFLPQSGMYLRHQMKTPKLLHEIQMDKIKLKHLSRDGMAPLIIKQEKMLNRKRAVLTDELLTKSKEVTEAAPVPELKSKASTSSVAGSKTTLSKTPSSELALSHGFRYHSNGDERLSRTVSAERAVRPEDQILESHFITLKQQLLKAALLHSRDKNGEYIANPGMVHDILRRDIRSMKTGSLPPENDDASVFAATAPLKFKAASDPLLFASNKPLHENPVIGRKYLIRENDKFRDKMVQHIRRLERCWTWHSVVSPPEQQNPGVHDIDIPLRASYILRSEPSLRSVRSTRNTALLPAKSTFNMRYGVSSRLLAARKPILDEYRMQELERTSMTEEAIKDFIMDVNELRIPKPRATLGGQELPPAAPTRQSSSTTVRTSWMENLVGLDTSVGIDEAFPVSVARSDTVASLRSSR